MRYTYVLSSLFRMIEENEEILGRKIINKLERGSKKKLIKLKKYAFYAVLVLGFQD